MTHGERAVDSTHKYIVVYMLDKPALGERFTKWPLHLTLKPWFQCAGSTEEVINQLGELAKGTKPFMVRTGKTAMYGPEFDVPVRLVEKTPELAEFHARICYLLTKNKCRSENEEYSRENYSPHITIRGDRHISEGTEVLVSSIDIVENLSDGRMGRKSIIRAKLKS